MGDHRRQIASNRTPRQINRNLIYNLIRSKGAVSRADLARLSGLQRSTISLIVEELIAGRWVLEGESASLPRGRRPTHLQLNTQRAVVALDIHPSQTTVAVADLSGRIVAQRVVKLGRSSGETVKGIIAAVRAMMESNSDRTFDGVGISLPGRADMQMQRTIFAPNMTWSVDGIRSQLEQATGLRVVVENVANACALSEVWFGESDGQHDLVVVNVSEGIGTGIFANGRLMRGEDGMAGEFGHIEVEQRGQLCGCGGRGCWETVASNRAALRYFHSLAPKKPIPSFDGLLRLALDEDPKATKVIEKMMRGLGGGMRMIASALAPKEIVVVGEIVGAWSRFGKLAQVELERRPLAHVPVLRPVRDSDTARLRSAVALVLTTESI
ncbi:ROK family protein [Granulicella arctica]|nr:ROK family protein [Granulicella arctica]